MAVRSYELQIDKGWINNTYRYRLDAATIVASDKVLAVIQLNPSSGGQSSNGTALSDPTIGKVAHWAIENRYSRVTFLNLFAFISTPQSRLSGRSFRSLVGPRNDEFIRVAIGGATTIVVGWGEPAGVAIELLNKRIGQVEAPWESAQCSRRGLW